MNWEIVYLTVDIVSGMMMFALTIFAFRQRDNPVAHYFGWLTLLAGIWAFSWILLVLSKDEVQARIGWSIIFSCIALTSTILLFFVIQYSGNGAWLTIRKIIFFLVIPCFSILVVWTNQYHKLFFTNVFYSRSVLFLNWLPEFGPWFWVHTLYSYLVISAALILIITIIIRSTDLYRRQAIALLIGALFPVAFSLVGTFRLLPLFSGSITHMPFILSCLVFAWAIFRYQFLDLAPVARSRLINTMQDGMLVLDKHNRIVDINPAMQFILRSITDQDLKKSEHMVGQPFGDVVGSESQLFQHIFDNESTNTEIKLGHRTDCNYYDLSISPIIDKLGHVVGRMIVLRDVSRRVEAENALREEQLKSDKLLLNILPESVADRLKKGEETISDGYLEATVLFADIVGFTSLSEELIPVELVAYLNRVFSCFDDLVKIHGLEKIKTIGDGYMVAGGVPEQRLDHADAIASLALDMMKVFQRDNNEISRGLQLRIGIDSGSLVAGVIGKQKFAYDMWGSTVTTASRMESHGSPGMIQVTGSIYQRLKGRYQFQYRGLIEVRGIGQMETWFLTGIQSGVP